jgi:ACR3 family arsenite efflux pump ArsB
LAENEVKLGWIEKLLALWIGLCIIIGLAIGKIYLTSVKTSR